MVTPAAGDPCEELDVLVVGAGLSGIGAAARLERDRPGQRYCLMEARGALGGTWDLFRYPGIRGDSDMFTLGYPFRPWDGDVSIADGPSILRYLRETAEEYRVDRHIRYHHEVESAEWSTAAARWTVHVVRTDTGERSQVTCRFLFMCTGYYRYDQGHRPCLPGEERFGGRLVHPQHWPEDLDYAGKRVVVIGSGATAITLVPAMARTAGHVTMLQRSPTYVISLPARDRLAARLQRRLPPRAAYHLVRWRNIAASSTFYRLSRRRPELVKRLIRSGVRRQLPAGFDLSHFTPRYDPWDQRLCVVPDGDLFGAIREGRAAVVTDRIATLDETGITLESGEHLDADIIVTATGLQLLPVGGIRLTVDGQPVEVHERVAYKAMMLAGVPNAAFTIGYTNASWTLKADLVAGYVCRLLRHLDETGTRQVTPLAPDPSEPTGPFLDLTAGYVQRSLDRLPRQGSRAPWRIHQDYLRDLAIYRRAPIEDAGIRFSSPAPAPAPAPGRAPAPAPGLQSGHGAGAPVGPRPRGATGRLSRRRRSGFAGYAGYAGLRSPQALGAAWLPRRWVRSLEVGAPRGQIGLESPELPAPAAGGGANRSG